MHFLFFLLLSGVLPAPASRSIAFSPVKIGGGGFVTGLFPTPRSATGPATVYMRTDVGGVFRLLNATGELSASALRPLTDGFGFKERNFYGVEALALSARSALCVWAALGAYFDSSPDTVSAGIFASADAGESWRRISPAAWAVRAGGNDSPQRGFGERLAVHPASEAVVLYGSNQDGLWRTADAQSAAPAWARAPCAEIPCGTALGVLGLLFDASSPGGDGVYASVPGAGIYASADAGITWKALAGGPSPSGIAYRMVLGGGSLWAATDAGVWRFGAGAWALATPSWPRTPFTCIDVSPFDPRDLIAQFDPSVDSLPVGALRSRDGGETWALVAQEITREYELPWWDASFQWNNTGEYFKLCVQRPPRGRPFAFRSCSCRPPPPLSSAPARPSGLAQSPRARFGTAIRGTPG
jgi:xyloglucan-specific exo-beta-1,4-glucanase